MENLIPAIMALLIPIIAVSIPIVLFNHKRQDRAEARRIFERLTLERLDVIKTAVAMGYNKQELADLDARLEQLIGPEQLQRILGTHAGVEGKDHQQLEQQDLDPADDTKPERQKAKS